MEYSVGTFRTDRLIQGDRPSQVTVVYSGHPSEAAKWLLYKVHKGIMSHLSMEFNYELKEVTSY